jgi:hypothetical protein
MSQIAVILSIRKDSLWRESGLKMKSKRNSEVPHWIQELGPPPTMVATVSEAAPETGTTPPNLGWERATTDSTPMVPEVFSAMCLKIKGIGPTGNGLADD